MAAVLKKEIQTILERSRPYGWVLEPDAKRIFKISGIPVPNFHRVQTADEAIAARRNAAVSSSSLASVSASSPASASTLVSSTTTGVGLGGFGLDFAADRVGRCIVDARQLIVDDKRFPAAARISFQAVVRQRHGHQPRGDRPAAERGILRKSDRRASCRSPPARRTRRHSLRPA